jgi:hypothetical protein
MLPYDIGKKCLMKNNNNHWQMSASIIQFLMKKKCYQFGTASMFYAWSLVSSFCYIFPLIWPLWCCIFLLFQHCVMWTCTRYIYTFICALNKQYKCDYVVIKLTMKTILYCIIINTCIWYKILNLFLSFLIVIYYVLATRQANGSCLR